MAFGGMMLPADLVLSLKDSVGRWRDRRKMLRELKWTKVTEKKYDEYQEFVRGTFRYINEKRITFRSVVFKKCELDWKRFHDGDSELGFYRLMHQFVLNAFMPFLYEGDRVLLYLDERSTSYKLSDLGDRLNAKLKEKHGWSYRPIRKVEPVDSSTCDILQMNDILMGAVAHQNNRREEKGCRPAKAKLARYVAEAAGLPDLRQNTPRSMTHFNIWQFRLSAKNGSPKT